MFSDMIAIKQQESDIYRAYLYTARESIRQCTHVGCGCMCVVGCVYVCVWMCVDVYVCVCLYLCT